jgi:hypothetical protein
MYTLAVIDRLAGEQNERPLRKLTVRRRSPI